MKLHAFKFGLACSISAIVLWVICSVFVAAMPAMMMSMMLELSGLRTEKKQA